MTTRTEPRERPRWRHVTIDGRPARVAVVTRGGRRAVLVQYRRR